MSRHFDPLLEPQYLTQHLARRRPSVNVCRDAVMNETSLPQGGCSAFREQTSSQLQESIIKLSLVLKKHSGEAPGLD